MGLGQLHDSNDAVSPVVGVVVLVAITVILAASTASFLFGFVGEQSETSSGVDLHIEYDQPGYGNLTFTHDEGDDLDPGRVRIESDTEFHPAPGNESGSPSPPAYRSLELDSNVDDGAGGTEQWIDGEVGAGTEFTVVGTASSDLSDATVRVIYVSESGDPTTTLIEWEGPDV